MEIHLSDEDDPFFLYQCVISEEDYYALKRDQGTQYAYNAMIRLGH